VPAKSLASEAQSDKVANQRIKRGFYWLAKKCVLSLYWDVGARGTFFYTAVEA
jgi:hypothetical protein